MIGQGRGEFGQILHFDEIFSSMMGRLIEIFIKLMLGLLARNLNERKL